MRILNLIEDTEGSKGCAFAHGLSFYVETENHKLLADLGPSGKTLDNAELLGVDLAAVDTVILSHGHYDHSGGIMPFASINKKARIYMQEDSDGDYYSDKGERGMRYIGIDKDIAALPQVVTVSGDRRIDDELALFVMDECPADIPFTNRILMKRVGEAYVRDDFRHEQFLEIRDGDWYVLFSGCAHNGIVNIVREYIRKTGREPDAVVSGFHLTKKVEYTDTEVAEIEETAKELAKMRTVFYTCHCTGLPAFEIMKRIMGEQLRYVHSGDDITL